MKRFAIAYALFVMVSLLGCSNKPDTLVSGGYDEAEMEAAIERAISEVDSFIEELHSGRPGNYSVKAPIEQNGRTEHFWLSDVTFKNGKFTGTIDNDPGIVTNVELGQKWTLGKTEISDWMYLRDGKIYGNYTMRPLLATMPEEEAEVLRSMLATP